MLSALRNAVARVGRRAALGTCATLLLVVGIGFFTAALWMYLAAVFDPMQAATMIGLGYSGAGLVCFGVLLSSGDPDPEPVPDPEDIQRVRQTVAAPPLVEAFLYGLQAGSQASKTQ